MSLPAASKIVQKICLNELEVGKELCDIVANIANHTIKERGAFNIGLSGGSMIKFLCQGLPNIQTEWAHWRFFFCDERLVPVDHPESTLRSYLEGLVGSTPVVKEQFIQVDTLLEASEAAQKYEAALKMHFPNVAWPAFDLLLLGMGPDGHTASLFPGHPLLDESKLWIAPITDSPKPPPSRVTMTMPVINHARVCIFAMAGEGKANMLKKILKDHDDLPCTRVKPENGELIWILDKAAASKL